MSDRSVGIIGLGIMGGAIARNLMERGWRVTGFDVDGGKQQALVAAGLAGAANAAEVARAAPVVLTSLPKPEALQKVAAEIAAARLPRTIVAELSTFTIEDKLAFKAVMDAAGHVALDCPLSGTGAQAARRDLVVMASGDRDAVEACRPLFADFSRTTSSLGAFGNGSRMKYVANLMVAIHNIASAEAMVLAIKSGLDPNDVVEVISAGAGTSRIFEMRGPMMARDVYLPASAEGVTWQKDMTVIEGFVRSLGVATPCFDATREVYDAALKAGYGQLDTAAVCKVIAARSGLQR